jgi:hypothetical protein
MTAPYVVHIQPVDQTELILYLVYLGPTLLAGPTATPYIDAAINLLNTPGFDPTVPLIMRRRGVNVNQLNYPLGIAAQLGVENQANPPFEYPLQQDGPGAVP